MKYTIEIEVRDEYGDGESWVATATGFDRSYTQDHVTAEEAMESAVGQLLRDVRYDRLGISDRAQQIEALLSWWSDIVEPKAECQVFGCTDRVPVDDLRAGPDGRQWCPECLEDVEDVIERAERAQAANERARELAYDRAEDEGNERRRGL